MVKESQMILGCFIFLKNKIVSEKNSSTLPYALIKKISFKN